MKLHCTWPFSHVDADAAHLTPPMLLRMPALNCNNGIVGNLWHFDVSDCSLLNGVFEQTLRLFPTGFIYACRPKKSTSYSTFLANLFGRNIY